MQGERSLGGKMIKVIAALALVIGFVSAQPTKRPMRSKFEKNKLQKIDISNYAQFAFTQPTENPAHPEFEGNEAQTRDHPQFTENEPRKMMEAIRVWKLTKALNLSEEQSTHLFPKLNEMKEARDEFERTRMKVINELEDYLRDAKKFGSEIKTKLQELEMNENNLREKEARLRKEIASILTPEQQAKFILFQMQFDKEMHEMISKLKAKGKEASQMQQGRRHKGIEKRKLWRFW